MGLTNNLGKLSNMITSTGSAVGIAQTSPAYTLDVTGTGRFTGNLTAAAFLGNLYTNTWYAGSGSTLSLRTAASGVIADFSPTSSNILGYVGINGSTASGVALSVYDTTSGSEQLRLCNSTGSGYWGIGRENNTTGDLYFNSGGTLRVTFKASGNVGIGTSSPTSNANYRYLTIMGASTSNGGVVDLRTSDSGVNMQMYVDNITGGNINVTTAHPLVFDTNGTERMRITSDGNVGVGLSGVYSNVRLMSRGVDATASNYAFRAETSAAANLMYIRNDGLIVTGLLSGSPYNYTTGSAANMYVSGGGELQRSTSSLKYKTDVRNYDKGLTEVLQMRPVYYKGKNDGDTQFAGLIAEEIHELGLTEFVQYAEDGSPDALAYANMIALLTKAIQEQNQIIQELNERLNKAGL